MEEKELLDKGERPLDENLDLPEADAIGHRLVHGGPSHRTPALIDDTLLKELKDLIPFAPLHLPREIALIEKLKDKGVPQVACFDTAFHRTLPAVAQHFPLPHSLTEEGLIRYGFHGLSYEYIAGLFPNEKRLIVAHLGNGCSLAAIKEGKSVDTTMGFTPTGGVMMGTRTGDLDPGLILYLLNHKKLSVQEVEKMVDFKSGLLGVSGVSSDMATLLDSSDQKAKWAIEMFCYTIHKAIGSLITALEGVDTLVFTAGIGEKAPSVREAICAPLHFLGLKLDKMRNENNETVISSSLSKVDVHVIPANEELMIAEHTWRILNGRSYL